MRKPIVLLLIFAIVIGSAVILHTTSASGTSTATISIDSTTQQFPSAHVGDTIQVNIVVSKVSHLWCWNIEDINFNPKVLNITNVTEGPYLKQAGQTMFIWTQGAPELSKGEIPEIEDILTTTNTASGSGILATLDFTVLQLGTSQITFNQTELDSSAATINYTTNEPISTIIPSTAINAVITVGPTSTSSPTPLSSTSSSASSDPSQSIDPAGSTSTPNAPEFPSIIIILPLFGLVTMSMMLFKKTRAKKT